MYGEWCFLESSNMGLTYLPTCLSFRAYRAVSDPWYKHTCTAAKEKAAFSGLPLWLHLSSKGAAAQLLSQGRGPQNLSNPTGHVKAPNLLQVTHRKDFTLKHVSQSSRCCRNQSRSRLQLPKVKPESTGPQHEQQDVFAIVGVGAQLHSLLGSNPRAEKCKAAKGCHQHAFRSH